MFFGFKRKASEVGGDSDNITPRQQKRQRMQSEEMNRRAVLQENDKLNSSLQSPFLSHQHNTLMQSVAQLQSLPESILARTFTFTDLVQDEPIDLPLSRDFTNKNNMALIFVSHRLHRLALRIFWSANSFTLRIEKFNAAAILPWWKHVNAVRKEVEDKPIVVANPKTNNFMDADFGPVTNNLTRDDLSDYFFSLRRTKLWSVITLPIGTITLDVPYNPHWSNLKSWLRLFHEGKVPALSSSDIAQGVLGFKDLHQIVGLFLSVQRDQGGKWEDVEKGLEGWQYTLTVANSRWQSDDGREEMLVIDDDGDDEQEAVEEEETKGDLLDQLSQDIDALQAPAATPGCDSTQTLGSTPPPSRQPPHTPGRFAQKSRVYFPDSEDEDDLAEDDAGEERMSSPEL
ncbi:hypothetical protein PRZ48_008850 [Zasmidium cellare]|uniref:Uncharacterized protein n=1 Tax=Zasmidium cellare TaxID=395010 RepID=A0ABR0EHE4_ZASCE|nr:hypothetical protein PRZ48_008850 [Zasmidium cellare]